MFSWRVSLVYATPAPNFLVRRHYKHNLSRAIGSVSSQESVETHCFTRLILLNKQDPSLLCCYNTKQGQPQDALDRTSTYKKRNIDANGITEETNQV